MVSLNPLGIGGGCWPHDNFEVVELDTVLIPLGSGEAVGRNSSCY